MAEQKREQQWEAAAENQRIKKEQQKAWRENSSYNNTWSNRQDHVSSLDNQFSHESEQLKQHKSWQKQEQEHWQVQQQQQQQQQQQHQEQVQLQQQQNMYQQNREEKENKHINRGGNVSCIKREYKKQVQAHHGEAPVLEHAKPLALKKNNSFSDAKQLREEIMKEHQFSKVNTGMVDEKRKFWIRSASSENLNKNQGRTGVQPKKHWLGERDWIRQQSLKAQMNGEQDRYLKEKVRQGNVHQGADEWIDLTKSHSSSAVLQESSSVNKGRNLSNAWSNEKVNIQTEHQVNETKKKYLDKTRQVTRSSKTHQNTYEPSLKLVNVSIERNGEDGKIHLSDTAQQQMSSFTSQMQRSQKTFTENKYEAKESLTKSAKENVVSSSKVERKTGPYFNQTVPHVSNATPKPYQASPVNEKPKEVEKLKAEKIEQTKSYLDQNSGMSNLTDEVFKTREFSVPSANLIESRHEASKVIGPNPPKIPFSKGKGRIAAPNAEQDVETKSPSVPNPKPRSITTPKSDFANSKKNLNVCSKSDLPMPVEQSWFNKEANINTQLKTDISTPSKQKSCISSTNNDQKTPLPVSAGWYSDEERDHKPTVPNKAATKKHVEFTTAPEVVDNSDDNIKNEQQLSMQSVKENIAKFHRQTSNPEVKSDKPNTTPDSLKGAVSTAKETFLQRTFSKEKEDSDRYQRQRELEEIAKARANANWDEQEESTAESIKDARNRELQEVAHLRSINQNGWQDDVTRDRLEQTRDQRNRELQEIASESLKGSVSTKKEKFLKRTFSQEKEESERYQRQRELQEIAKARANANWDEQDESGAESIKDIRNRELQEVAHLRSINRHEWQDDISRDRLEQTRDQRNRELQEIANMRSQTNWDEVASTAAMAGARQREMKNPELDAKAEQRPEEPKVKVVVPEPTNKDQWQEIEEYMREQSENIENSFRPPPPPPKMDDKRKNAQ